MKNTANISENRELPTIETYSIDNDAQSTPSKKRTSSAPLSPSKRQNITQPAGSDESSQSSSPKKRLIESSQSPAKRQKAQDDSAEFEFLFEGADVSEEDKAFEINHWRGVIQEFDWLLNNQENAQKTTQEKVELLQNMVQNYIKTGNSTEAGPLIARGVYIDWDETIEVPHLSTLPLKPLEIAVAKGDISFFHSLIDLGAPLATEDLNRLAAISASFKKLDVIKHIVESHNLDQATKNKVFGAIFTLLDEEIATGQINNHMSEEFLRKSVNLALLHNTQVPMEGHWITKYHNMATYWARKLECDELAVLLKCFYHNNDLLIDPLLLSDNESIMDAFDELGYEPNTTIKDSLIGGFFLNMEDYRSRQLENPEKISSLTSKLMNWAHNSSDEWLACLIQKDEIFTAETLSVLQDIDQDGKLIYRLLTLGLDPFPLDTRKIPIAKLFQDLWGMTMREDLSIDNLPKITQELQAAHLDGYENMIHNRKDLLRLERFVGATVSTKNPQMIITLLAHVSDINRRKGFIVKEIVDLLQDIDAASPDPKLAALNTETKFYRAISTYYNKIFEPFLMPTINALSKCCDFSQKTIDKNLLTQHLTYISNNPLKCFIQKGLSKEAASDMLRTIKVATSELIYSGSLELSKDAMAR